LCEIYDFQIASAMVACTFISAPLMFVSAKMISLHKLNPKDYVYELDTFLLNLSIIALVAAVSISFNLLVLSFRIKIILRFFCLVPDMGHNCFLA